MTLPIHSRTGLTAIGLRRDGRPIWPVMGGDGSTDPPAPPAPPAPPPTDPPKPPADEPLAEPGKKALEAERRRANAAEAELAKFRKAEQDRADAEKSELQKAADAQKAAEERAAASDQRALRLEVAHDKGLTPAQAKRLVGSTREELEADADEILRDFPTKPAATPPKPDPGQGARPGDKTASTASGKSLYEQRHPKKTTA